MIQRYFNLFRKTKNTILTMISPAIIFFFLSFTVTDSAYAHANSFIDSEVVYKLNKFDTLRVGITEAPGVGHQSAGATVVSRLREIGYAGEIEIIYDSIDTARKLISLIPPFKGPSAGEYQEYSELKLRFMSKNYLKNNNLPLIPLAVMGADDKSIEPSDLNAEALLKLQPMDWGMLPQLKFGTQDAIKFPQLRPLGYLFNAPNPPNIEQFVQDQLSHEAFSKARNFFIALFHQGNIFELLPVYGHGVRNSENQLEKLLAALNNATSNVENALQKGIVIPVFNELDREGLANLQKFLSFNNQTNVIQVFDVSDPELIHQLYHGKENKIIVVKVGSVPKPLFEYVYSKATLPSVVEGLNSTNFVASINKTYLPSAMRRGFHFQLPEDSQDRIEILLKGAWTELSISTIKTVPHLTQFYYEALTNKEPLLNYFSRHKFERSENDKLLQGLVLYFNEKKKNPELIKEHNQCPSLFLDHH